MEKDSYIWLRVVFNCIGIYFLWHLSKINLFFNIVFMVYTIIVIMYYYNVVTANKRNKILKNDPLLKRVITPEGKIGVITSYMNGTACVRLKTGVYHNYNIDQLTLA